MRDAFSIQDDIMNAIKNYSRSVSETQPMIGRLGALPVATIDVVSQGLSCQIFAVQMLAMTIFETFKAIFSGQMDKCLDGLKTLAQLPLLSLIGMASLITSPIAIIDQTIQVIKDPAKNFNYKSGFRLV
jgi:hypothetical protein